MNTNQISLMNLFEVGAHRGNRRSKLNPRLKNRVYAYSKGLCLIDLAKTSESINLNSEFLKNLGAKRKQILVVGTSKHLSPLVKEISAQFDAAMPYVNNRWLGGTLTNWSTIRKTLKNKDKYEKIIAKKEFFDSLSRNEQLNIERELEKLRLIFDGLIDLKSNKPGAVLVLNADENAVAIKEAEVLGIPVITVTNTSTVFLPSTENSVICLNTNSIKAVKLVIDSLVSSYNEGLKDAPAVVIAPKPIVNNYDKSGERTFVRKPYQKYTPRDGVDTSTTGANGEKPAKTTGYQGKNFNADYKPNYANRTGAYTSKFGQSKSFEATKPTDASAKSKTNE